MFKGKVLFEMKDEPAPQVQHAQEIAQVLSSGSSEDQIKAKLEAIESREK